MNKAKTMTVDQIRLLKKISNEGRRIQHRFKAEPLYARTGRGYMKSEGVRPLQKIKPKSRKTNSKS